MTDEALQNLETREAELWVKIKEAQSQVDSLSIPWSEARNAIAKEKQRREIIAELAAQNRLAPIIVIDKYTNAKH